MEMINLILGYRLQDYLKLLTPKSAPMLKKPFVPQGGLTEFSNRQS